MIQYLIHHFFILWFQYNLLFLMYCVVFFTVAIARGCMFVCIHVFDKYMLIHFTFMILHIFHIFPLWFFLFIFVHIYDYYPPCTYYIIWFIFCNSYKYNKCECLTGDAHDTSKAIDVVKQLSDVINSGHYLIACKPRSTLAVTPPVWFLLFSPQIPITTYM